MPNGRKGWWICCEEQHSNAAKPNHVHAREGRHGLSLIVVAQQSVSLRRIVWLSLRGVRDSMQTKAHIAAWSISLRPCECLFGHQGGPTMNRWRTICLCSVLILLALWR